ncbi:MAG: NTP transferase domain-containing protein [Dehalococcoidia bacterium]|nr:NTP transferase domain-containing protein [Dehalococcoidia bacterium]
MRAIVLVGGEGTRLRPLTWRTPKQLVPVLNRPLLEHLMLHLREYEVTRVTLAMTNRNALIRDTFGDGAALGIELDYAYEDTPLGSGGAIASVAAGWDEPFLVCNGDIVTDLDLRAMIEAHRTAGAELSMHLHEVDDPSSFGVAVVDDGGRITRFVEKPPRESAPSRLINAGTWLFEPGLLAEMDATAFNRVEDTLFPRLCEERRAIVGFQQPGYWRDIGNPEALRLVNLELATREAAGVVQGEGCEVAADAAIEAPSVLGAACRLEASARVERSLLWDGVCLGQGATVRDSVLGPGVTVEAGAIVDRSVVAHGATVAAGARLEGASVEPDARYED